MGGNRIAVGLGVRSIGVIIVSVVAVAMIVVIAELVWLMCVPM